MREVFGVAGKIIDSLNDWNSESEVSNYTTKLTESVIARLLNVPGMTSAHSRDFRRATPIFTLRDGAVVKTYKNPVGVDHIFLADSSGKMLFGGFVDWTHSQELKKVIENIKKEFT